MSTNTETANGDKIVAEEQRKLGAWRTKRNRTGKVWSGLALSGGGVRSATYSLGVLQALARNDQLKEFDYLSTVSGGGFIGTSLHWWWSNKHDNDNEGNQERSRIMQFFAKVLEDPGQQKISKKTVPLGRFGTGPADFPYGTDHPDPSATNAGKAADNERQKKVLNFLRSHGNYLVPGNGINIWSGIGVVLRSVFLNLIVWIPLVAIVFLILAADCLEPYALMILNYLPNDGMPLPETLIPKGWGSQALEPLWLRDVHTLPATFALLIWVAYAFVTLFVLCSVIFSFQTSTSNEVGHMSWTRGHGVWLLVATIAAFLAYLLFSNKTVADFLAYLLFNNKSVTDMLRIAIGATLALGSAAVVLKIAIIWLGVKNMSITYLLRRFFEKSFGKCFRWFLLILALGLVPVAFKLVFTSTAGPGVTGVFAVASGIAAALWQHYQSLRKIVPGLASRILLPAGAALFLFGVAVLGYQLAMIFKDVDIITVSTVDGKISYGGLSVAARGFLEAAILTLFLVALVSSVVVNTNHIGLNRFYRDRLTEAFMPTASAIQSGKVERSPTAERVLLHEAWNKDYAGPYALINTNVVLVNDAGPKYHLRGGDNYVLSPFFCGSSATGWYPTTDDCSRRTTLSSAMTASGAAANPNAGYLGAGLTRNRLLSVVMMLMGVRLGHWIVNPNPEIFRKLAVIRPKHIYPGGTYALTGRGWRWKSKFLEITDGGHFDNLGVYELIRRKCGLIVVCDGEADEKTAYRALVSVQRRIEEDFGATIVLTRKKGPELLVAKYPMDYPSGADEARQSFFLAKVKYKDGSEADIIYMKATMIDDLSFKVKGYKGLNLDFPHQATADQFFDPEQFEAYRELGYRTGMLMMKKLNLKNLLNAKLAKKPTSSR